MAWTVTDRGTGDQHATSTDWVSGSFTPAANAMLLCFVWAGSEEITGITGHDGGSSWVRVFQYEDVPEANRDLEIWACFTGASPSAGTVTVSHGYVWNCGLTLVEIQESVNSVDTSGSVANAFGTDDINYGYDLRNEQITLASFADSSNLTFCGHCAGGGDKDNTINYERVHRRG